MKIICLGDARRRHRMLMLAKAILCLRPNTARLPDKNPAISIKAPYLLQENCRAIAQFLPPTPLFAEAVHCHVAISGCRRR